MNISSMNIAITIDHTYIPYAYTMLVSLLENNSVNVDIYVVSSDLSQEDSLLLCSLSQNYPVSFHFMYLSDTLLSICQNYAAGIFSPESYIRLLLAELLPGNLERVLYLDTDVIINNDIDDLYNLKLCNKKFAACISPYNGFQTGVLLLNLNALRKNASLTCLLENNANAPHSVHELFSSFYSNEDILCFDGRQFNLSAAYAFTQLNIHDEDLRKNVSIIHYSGEKPWQGDHLHNDTERLWWNYAAKTPFYPEFLEKVMQEIVMSKTVHTYISNLQAEHRQLQSIVAQYELLLKKTGLLP